MEVIDMNKLPHTTLRATALLMAAFLAVGCAGAGQNGTPIPATVQPRTSAPAASAANGPTSGDRGRQLDTACRYPTHHRRRYPAGACAERILGGDRSESWSGVHRRSDDRCARQIVDHRMLEERPLDHLCWREARRGMDRHHGQSVRLRLGRWRRFDGWHGVCA